MARAISTYLIGMAVWWASLCGASSKNVQEIFLQANKAYTNNNLDEAYTLYKTIDDKGPAVWFNMGNIALSKGLYADAVLYFKRAERGASRALYHDIITHIACAQTMAELPRSDSWRDALYAWVNNSMYGFPTIILQIIFSIGWLATIYFFWQRRLRGGYLVCALLGMLFLGAILFVRYKKMYTVSGVVMSKEAMLYVVPDEHVDSVTPVHETEIVTIQDEKSGWYKVTTSHGAGWIKATFVGRI